MEDASVTGNEPQAYGSTRWLQCYFRTGAWQCRRLCYGKPNQDQMLCEIHAEGLRTGVSSTYELWQILCARRAEHQATYPPQSSFSAAQILEWKRLRYVDGLTDDEALAHMSSLPFYWQPVEQCWHTLTGLPAPVSSVHGLTP